jgi:GR25 family glycosyltransferase involved in LPS biosynthesis
MNNPFDFFEDIYCISLDSQLDRWESAQEEFNKVSILGRVKKFSGIKNTPTYSGANASHLNVVKMAKEAKLKNVLIFEDDIAFDVNTLDIVSKSIKELKLRKWDLFFMGLCGRGVCSLVDDHLLKLSSAACIHAWALNESCYDKFIEDSYLNPIALIDGHLANQMKERYISYSCFPLVADQKVKFRYSPNNPPTSIFDQNQRIRRNLSKKDYKKDIKNENTNNNKK